MRIVAILALAAIATAPAPKPAAKAAAKPVCQNAGMSFADRQPARLTVHPLRQSRRRSSFSACSGRSTGAAGQSWSARMSARRVVDLIQRKYGAGSRSMAW